MRLGLGSAFRATGADALHRFHVQRSGLPGQEDSAEQGRPFGSAQDASTSERVKRMGRGVNSAKG